jgi:hypothetical protein
MRRNRTTRVVISTREIHRIAGVRMIPRLTVFLP